MQGRLFWLIFIVLSVAADMLLPFVWSLVATIPIFIFSWWVVYKSDWF